MHTEQPYGTGTEVHNTGNFVTVSTETATDADADYDVDGLREIEQPILINRVEYYEDTPPTYLSTVDVDDDYAAEGGTPSFQVSDVEVGRYRVADAEYFFVVYEGEGDVAVRVGDTPHTPTELGTVDFTNEGSDYTEYDEGLAEPTSGIFRADNQDLATIDADAFEGDSVINDGSAEEGVTGVEEVRSYNLFFDLNTDTPGQSIRTQVNVELDSPQLGTNDEPEWESSQTTDGSQDFIVDASSGEGLEPGQNFPLDVGVEVPLGVDQLNIQEGTVTVRASEST